MNPEICDEVFVRQIDGQVRNVIPEEGRINFYVKADLRGLAQAVILGGYPVRAAK